MKINGKGSDVCVCAKFFQLHHWILGVFFFERNDRFWKRLIFFNNLQFVLIIEIWLKKGNLLYQLKKKENKSFLKFYCFIWELHIYNNFKQDYDHLILIQFKPKPLYLKRSEICKNHLNS